MDNGILSYTSKYRPVATILLSLICPSGLILAGVATPAPPLPAYLIAESPKQGGGDYLAALSITAPYPAPCGVAAPAVPAARYCKRSYGFARLLSLPLSAQDTAG